jgi:hypothetical protein
MFSFRQTWIDSKRRPWASEVMSFDDVATARRAHASSCQGLWVKAGMLEAQVTPLYWQSEGRVVAVQWPDGKGGVTTESIGTRPPADIAGLISNGDQDGGPAGHENDERSEPGDSERDPFS